MTRSMSWARNVRTPRVLGFSCPSCATLGSPFPENFRVGAADIPRIKSEGVFQAASLGEPVADLRNDWREKRFAQLHLRAAFRVARPSTERGDLFGIERNPGDGIFSRVLLDEAQKLIGRNDQLFLIQPQRAALTTGESAKKLLAGAVAQTRA